MHIAKKSGTRLGHRALFCVAWLDRAKFAKVLKNLCLRQISRHIETQMSYSE